MSEKHPRYRCPVCKGPVNGPGCGVEDSEDYFPFCSRRCKLIDLGRWLDGRYKISTPVAGGGEDSMRERD